MRYITFDEAGNVTGAYLQDLNQSHVTRYIEATPEQYADWLNLRVVNGVLIAKPPAPPAPPPVPEVVTMRQARLALLGAGLLGGVNAAIAALPSPQKEVATIEWEYSQTVERNRPFVLTLGEALGLTSAQLDELFVQAATL